VGGNISKNFMVITKAKPMTASPLGRV